MYDRDLETSEKKKNEHNERQRDVAKQRLKTVSIQRAAKRRARKEASRGHVA